MKFSFSIVNLYTSEPFGHINTGFYNKRCLAQQSLLSFHNLFLFVTKAGESEKK